MMMGRPARRTFAITRSAFIRRAIAGLLPASLACLLTGGCSTTAINALVPSAAYHEQAEIAYGEGARHKLDVYVPTAAANPAPVVIFFYGGGWIAGDKDMYLFVGQAFASRGFVTVIPDYRLYPEARYPAFLQDGAASVRWTVDHISELGGDPKHIYLAGHSAGAYIAAMLNLDRRWLGDVGIDPRQQIRATVGLAGPYDFLPLDTDQLKAIFGPPEQWPSTQPINHVEGDAPPMLLVAGAEDDVVRPANVAHLAARIRAKGGRVEEKYYYGIGHMKLVGALADPLRFLAPVLDDTTAFMNDNR
jgi:acetyl esterase/lipase